MARSQVNYQQAIENARKAAEEGDRELAIKWAKYAVSLAPERAAAWLVLGDLLDLKQRLKCYTKALEINPNNTAARKKLGEAVKELRHEQSRQKQELTPKIRLGVPFKTTIRRRTSLKAALMVVIAVATLGMVAWGGISTIPEFVDASAGLFPTETSEVNLASRANPITPTPTATPTPTQTPTSTPTPTPIPTSTPRPPTATPRPVAGQHPWNVGDNEFWIEINLSTQQLFAHRGDDLLDTFWISSGTWATPTITGSFQIYQKLRSQTMAGFDYYLPDVPYVMYFYKDYAIHGAYWHTNFGNPMSHGCVNMVSSEAGWLFQNAKIGTWVIIHY
jgi:lipoprotein-anchoring transpeptidase ErfK/SrfK